MIQLNPEYEKIFNPRHIDDNCNFIADKINHIGQQIDEILKAGMYKQAVTMYLQLLKSMTVHFVKDEHYCYFDDLYAPEYELKAIYENIKSFPIDEDCSNILFRGHTEILDSECYQDYGYPSYID